MKMASMWYAINHSDIEKSMKQVIFVGINIVLWQQLHLLYVWQEVQLMVPSMKNGDL